MPETTELAKMAESIEPETIWQIVSVWRNGTSTGACTLGDVFYDPYPAIALAHMLNGKQDEYRYFVVKRTVGKAKYAYDGVTTPKELEDDW